MPRFHQRRTYRQDPRWIRVRYPTTCVCGAALHRGGRAFFFPATNRLHGERCGCGERAARDFEAARFDEEVYA